jgi:hypothetical protein
MKRYKRYTCSAIQGTVLNRSLYLKIIKVKKIQEQTGEE